ncbi:MAG: hypothetical protein AAGE99_00060 [Chlamydiota bacterium]
MINDEKFILFSDVKRLFSRHFKGVVLGALLFGGVGLWVRTQIPVRYEIKATFKDGVKATGSQGGIFENLLKNMSIEGERQGDVLMTSSLVLEPVVEKLGLQITVNSCSKWKKSRTRFFEALRAERKKPLEKGRCFAFENVSYLGDVPKFYHLYFITDETFELREGKKRVLFRGKTGEKIVADRAMFTIKAIPDDIELRTYYPLKIEPLQEVVLSLRSQIDAVQHSSTPGILELTFFHSDLFVGKEVLDSIMQRYRKYLTLESERVSAGQIAYLEKRRDELCMKMHQHFQSHVAYLKKNIRERGSLTLGQYLPIFQERKANFSKDLIDLKLKRGKLKNGEMIDLGQEMVAVQADLHQMLKERDALSLALFKTAEREDETATQLHKLDRLDKEKFRVRTGVDAFFAALLKPVRDERRMLLTTTENGAVFLPESVELKKIEEGKKRLVRLIRTGLHPGLTTTYLENNLRLLSLQEEVLKKRLLSGATERGEYQGIDMQTGRQLLLDYLRKRDDLFYKYRQMEFGKKQLEKEAIEHISLAEIFSDTVSRGLTRELGEMTQVLRKKSTLTERDIERLEKKFAAKKEDLILHMKETMDLTLLEKEGVEEQIRSIRMAILDLIGKEIALIERQVEDRIDEKLRLLDREERLIREELEHLKNEMEEVPDRWLREKELAFSADMNQGMLEALVQLVESKSVENNLSMIESQPINAAYTSFIPKSPLLKVFGSVGACIGALVAFAGYFIRALCRGFPIGLKNLAVRGRKVMGTLRNNPEKDLEVFRNLSLLLHRQGRLPLIVTLILGEGEDYSLSFANLLAKEGKRLLLLDLNVSKKIEQENLPGLGPYLAGEVKEVVVRKKDFGATLSFGRNRPYAQELLKSPKFDQFLGEVRQKYDVVLLVVDERAKQAFPKHFFAQSDVIAVRLNEDSYDGLVPYLNWEDRGHALAFLG